MTKANMTLQVFDITPNKTEIEILDYSNEIASVLATSKKISDRFYKSNHDGNESETIEIEDSKAHYDEGDFIPSFGYTNGFLFGSFIRIRPGEMSSVTLEQLDKKAVKLTDMVKDAEEGIAGTIKEYAYFCMYKKFLVMSKARNNRKSLQEHFNWLLWSSDPSICGCQFTPKRKQETELPIGQIKEILIQEEYYQGLEKTEFSERMFDLKAGVLKKLMVDLKGSEELDWDDVLEATVRIKINKRKAKMNRPGYSGVHFS